jgi:cold shock CspA family protein
MQKVIGAVESHHGYYVIIRLQNNNRTVYAHHTKVKSEEYLNPGDLVRVLLDETPNELECVARVEKIVVPANGCNLRATVKSFREGNFGFLTLEDGRDAFLHSEVLERCTGRDSLRFQTKVYCDVEPNRRGGLCVTRIRVP